MSKIINVKINGVDFKNSKEYPMYLVNYEGSLILRENTRKPLKMITRSDGYIGVRTSQYNKPKNSLVHVMVMLAWKSEGRTETRCFINHKDGDKLNPHGDNLEWVTASENQQHALSCGLKQKGQGLYNSVLKDEDVHKICRLLCDGLTCKSIAELFDCKPDNVRKIKDGSCYFHIRNLYPNIIHKYKWEFSESTVRWVCLQIKDGFSDRGIVNISNNKHLTVIDVKRIRHKIRYSDISSEYF